MLVRFNTFADVVVHIYYKHALLLCARCLKFFHDEDELRTHYAEEHNCPKAPYLCNLTCKGYWRCIFTFNLHFADNSHHTRALVTCTDSGCNGEKFTEIMLKLHVLKKHTDVSKE